MKLPVAALCAATLTLSSCLSLPAAYDPGGKPSTAHQASLASTASSSGAEGAIAAAAPLPAPSSTQVATPASLTGPVAEAELLKKKAKEAGEAGHLSEAIFCYVGIIALYKEGSEALKPQAEEAVYELQRIGARLSLEAGSDWIDPATGSQRSFESRYAVSGPAPNPSVYLYENFGSGKSPVQDAPIRFEFAANSGSISPLVRTDAYGKANATILSLERPGAETLIKAYPVFAVRATTYAFKSVARDFSYRARPNTARLLVVESLDSAMALGRAAPFAPPLAAKGLSVSLIEGGDYEVYLPRLKAGDAGALKELRGSSSFLILVSIDAAAPAQVVLNGKKYEIYTSAATASLRVVDAESRVLFAIPSLSVKGQGGNPRAAVEDGLVRSRDAIIAALEKQGEEIERALSER